MGKVHHLCARELSKNRATRASWVLFSASNLWRMRQFHETYRGLQSLAPLVRELSWTSKHSTATSVSLMKMTASGLLLCASKDDEVVEYALSRPLSPALVAEYKTKLPDKALLQAKLHEFLELTHLPEPTL